MSSALVGAHTLALFRNSHELKTGTGIMITGSHNPPEYNGLKMMIGGVTLAEDRIQTLLHNLRHNTLSTGSGDVSTANIAPDFIAKMLPICELSRPLMWLWTAETASLAALRPKSSKPWAAT